MKKYLVISGQKKKKRGGVVAILRADVRETF